MNDKKKVSGLLSFYEWIETFLLALCCVILIFTFAVKFVTVSGSSMENTLHNGDRLLITSILYEPKAGDIVVVDVTHNEKADAASSPYIKRIIATEGQTVDIDPNTWTVYVNGVAIEEPYVNPYNTVGSYYPYPSPMISGDTVYPHTVSKDCVFVMGDNRNGSTDSRKIGEIHKNNIIGKVILRLTPNFGGVD